MRAGLFAIAVVLWLAPVQAIAADPPITFQTQPLGRLLDELRTIIQSVGGDDAVKEFNKEIKQSLGDKGFDGFDLNRPIVGYIDIPADPTGTVAVICFPVTGEKEWLEFCERWNKSKPKALKDGLYEVPPPNPGMKAAMRIADGYAYIAAGMNDPARVLDAKTLTPFVKIYDGADVSLMAGRVNVDRLPKELRALAKDGLANFKKLLPNLGAAEKAIAEPLFTLASKALELSEGAKDAALRVNLDSFTGELIADLTVNAVPGTPLDKHIAGMKPATNKFAGIIGPDAAAGIKLRFPLEIPEVKAAAVAGLEEIQKEAKNLAFQPLQATIDELLKGLIRTVKTGEMDAAAVLRGPSKDGTFSAVAGIAFDDPSAFEKELKKSIAATAPQTLQDAIKWDAEKANGASIHTIDLANMPGDREVKALFGQNAMVAFCFAPKAIYFAIGPGGEPVAAIKNAMAVKPVPAPLLDFAYNADRIVKMIGAIEPQGAAMAAKLLGKQDKLVSALALSVNGGKQLQLKFGLNVKLTGSWFGFRKSSAIVEP